MSETISLFNELKTSGYDACLMTTFSIDFPFYEDVLLRRMQSSGINHHLLFVDKAMSLAAMHERPPCKAGAHYMLAPMECPGAFHPKLLLLLGKNKGLLAVGSHNATLSGFGQNLEITNVLRFNKGSDERYLSVFQDSFKAFKEWLVSYGSELPASVKESLDRTVHLSPWLEPNLDEPQSQNAQLLFSSKNTESLWDQLEAHLPANSQQFIGISAFFDTQLEFVKRLVTVSSEPPLIAIQPDTVSAPESLLNFPDVRVVDISSVEDIHKINRYVHAKLFYLSGDESLFVSGSANFSRPAWLSDGKRRNAEAVLVVKGGDADEIAADLSLRKLKDAVSVKEITSQTINQASAEFASVALMLLDDKGTEIISIPMHDCWPEDHRLVYIDSFGVSQTIEATRHSKYWNIPRQNLREGELVSVVSDNAVIARIIVLNVAQLRHNSSAGKERALQQALGSLNSDNPDIDLLFKCFGQMIPSESEDKKTAGKRSANVDHTETDEPDSLISSLEVDNVRRANSGRARCSTGDIGLLLDMFIYNLGTASRSDSGAAYGEDALGRNEEDLIGSEDGEEVRLSEIPEKPEDDKAAKAKADKFCQKKLHTILKGAENRIKSNNGGHGEDAYRQNVPVILAVLVLVNELFIAQKKQAVDNRAWVTNNFFSELSGFLFLHVFSEKNPIQLNSEKLGETSVFLSDEWGRMLGYAAWVAYHSDVVLKARLPVSASIEEKDKLRWKNACWLFLAQRIASDSVASEIAAKLLSEEGKQAENWLNMLSESGREIVANKRLPISAGFLVASSPKAAFEGLKFVTELEDEFVRLANINTVQNSNRFKTGFLDIFEVEAE